MFNDKKKIELLNELLSHQLAEHPLPWRYERDWSHEVIAEDMTVVAKFMEEGDARSFIELAREHQKKLGRKSTIADKKVASLIG